MRNAGSVLLVMSLVNQTTDDVDRNAVWTEFRDLMNVRDKERASLTNRPHYR